MGHTPVHLTLQRPSQCFLCPFLFFQIAPVSGEAVAAIIERVVSTYLVVFHLQEAVAGLSSERTPLKTSIQGAVLNAEGWLAGRSEEHEPIARRLELGNSWRRVCRIIFTKIEDTGVLNETQEA